MSRRYSRIDEPEATTPEIPWWWTDDWAQGTLDVVERVWRREGLKLYFHPALNWLKDDLHSWLVLEAMKFRADYEPPGDTDDPEATWYAILTTVLRRAANRHFGKVMRAGVQPREAWNIAHTSDSVDRITERHAETGYLPGVRRLYGDIFTGDPEDVLILLEDIAATEDPDAGQPKEAGLCTEYGCRQPAFARGYCNYHYTRHREQWGNLDGTSAICKREGCTRYATVRGYCQSDYDMQLRRELAKTAPPCLIPNCDKPQYIRGVCVSHYGKHIRGTLPPEDAQHMRPPKVYEKSTTCSVPGCQEPRTDAASRCREHLNEYKREWKRRKRQRAS